MESNVEYVEKYVILALGVKKEPMPSEIHMQKELFILSNVKKDIQEHFNFEKHYLGPFSHTLYDVVESPVFVKNAFRVENGKIILMPSGQMEYNNINREYLKESKFKQLLIMLKMIRDIYDRLTKHEFLFLIYETYPQYTEFSNISNYLLKNLNVRKRIIDSLFSKGIITEMRRKELLEENLR